MQDYLWNFPLVSNDRNDLCTFTIEEILTKLESVYILEEKLLEGFND